MANNFVRIVVDIKKCREFFQDSTATFTAVSYNTALQKVIHSKKRLAVFPSPAGMSPTKLSLAGNNLIIPLQLEFGKWNPGRGRKNR